jgi:O-antigen chain-terminating methyltransferase
MAKSHRTGMLDNRYGCQADEFLVRDSEKLPVGLPVIGMSMHTSNSTRISDVVQQIRAEVREAQSPTPSPNASLIPAPPELYVTSRTESVEKQFAEAEERTLGMTEVSRFIPKVLRRLFRRQGGFNKEIVGLGRLLNKQQRGTAKRVDEIVAYLRAQNGWFDSVLSSFETLGRRASIQFENQRSFERRLLGLDGKLTDIRFELSRRHRDQEDRVRQLAAEIDHLAASLQKDLVLRAEHSEALEKRLLVAEAVREQLERERDARLSIAGRLNEHDTRIEGVSDIVQRVQEGLVSEAKAREATDSRLEEYHTRIEGVSDIVQRVQEGLVGEARAREATDSRLEEHHTRIEGVSDILRRVQEGLVSEARAREATEVRLDANHGRIDSLSHAIEALRQTLFAEAAARESLAGRLDEGQRRMQATDSLQEAIPAMVAANERLQLQLRETTSALAGIKNTLARLEEQHISETSYLKRELHLHSSRLFAFNPSPQPSRTGKVVPAPGPEVRAVDKRQFDSFYLAFENKFRGSRQDIKQRVKVYLPFVKDAKAGKRGRPVIDLGCGRGEWLELLRDEKLVGQGIDLNEFMVAECTERKLSVGKADALEHLGGLRAGTAGGITAFHVIEHLPFPSLLRLCAECLRVLRPGGILILETPNPDNLQVGANRFYTDPTHLHPLPHQLTQFILAAAGFRRVDVLPLHPDPDAVALTQGSGAVETVTHRLLFGAQDYAVIGRK